jgi:hypothetical protein
MSGELPGTMKSPYAPARTILILGSMDARGAFSAGVLKTFADVGMQFDEIRASWVGALNAAYFLTGQVDDLISLWKYHAQGRNAADWIRGWLPCPAIMDHEYVLRNILDRALPLVAARAPYATRALRIALLDQSLRSISKAPPVAADAMVDFLRRYCRRQVEQVIGAIGERPSTAVADPLPLHESDLTSGDDVFVVLDQPIDKFDVHNTLERLWGRLTCGGSRLALRPPLRGHISHLRRTCAWLQAGHPSLVLIRPDGDADGRVHRHWIRSSHVKRALSQGREHAYRALEQWSAAR